MIHIGVELRRQGILTEEIPIREPQGFIPIIYIVTDSYMLQQEWAIRERTNLVASLMSFTLEVSPEPGYYSDDDQQDD